MAKSVSKDNESIEMGNVNTSSPVGGLYFHYDIGEDGEAVSTEGQQHLEDEYVPIEVIDKLVFDQLRHENSSNLASPGNDNTAIKQIELANNLEPGQADQQHGACSSENSNVHISKAEELGFEVLWQDPTRGKVVWNDATSDRPSPSVVEGTSSDASLPKKPERSFKAPTNTEYDEDNYTLGNNETSSETPTPVQSRHVSTVDQQPTHRGVFWYAGVSAVVTVMVGGAICGALLLPPNEPKTSTNDTGKFLPDTSHIVQDIEILY